MIQATESAVAIDDALTYNLNKFTWLRLRPSNSKTTLYEQQFMKHLTIMKRTLKKSKTNLFLQLKEIWIQLKLL